MRRCEIDICDTKHYAKGYCQNHYNRLRKHGDPNILGHSRWHPPALTHCIIDGCDGELVARGWCKKHYMRWYQNGDPLINKYENRRKNGTGNITNEGYIILSGIDHPNASYRGRILEHTLIMSNILGRPLEKGEIVHHKNGDRGDNRLENLELCTVHSHIKGQRLEDVLENCIRDYLVLYGKDKLLELIEVLEENEMARIKDPEELPNAPPPTDHDFDSADLDSPQG